MSGWQWGPDVSIGDVLAMLAAELPDQPAVITADGQLTYAEVAGRAGWLAARLAIGNAAVPVLVLPENGFDLVVGVFGVVGAGRSMVPLPADVSAEMIADVVAATGADTIVGREPPDVAGVERIRFGDVGSEPYRPVPLNHEVPYLTLYTSGSTGRPKMVSWTPEFLHATLGHELDTDPRIVPRRGDRFGMTFAVSGMVVVGVVRVLVIGATAILLDPSSTSPARLAEAYRDHGVTVLRVVPSIARRIAEAAPEGVRFESLRSLRCGGEPLWWSDVAALRRLLPPGAVITNLYGMTEVGGVARKAITSDEPIGIGQVSVGHAYEGREFWIDDGTGGRADPGVAGEIIVESTTVPNRSRSDPERPKYEVLPDGRFRFRTADLGRINVAGELEHLGRLDQMVKIGGSRIEPAVVENVIRHVAGVTDVAVVPQVDSHGEQRLVAHVVVRPGSAITPSDLRRFVRARTTSAAVPGAFQLHDQPLPLLPGGKVDRATLAAMEVSGPEREIDPPADDLEGRVAACMAEVLGLAEIGATEDFFDLGGDSLRAQRLCALLARRKVTDVPASTLLGSPTARALATSIRSGDADRWTNLVALREAGSRPPLIAFHARSGEAILYGALAEHLGPDQPVYALQAETLTGRPPRWTTVEEIASAYFDQIIDRLPTGPYLLFGYSFGGFVAVEVARLLVASGREVEMLALGDTPVPVRSGSSGHWLYPTPSLRTVVFGGSRAPSSFPRRLVRAGRHVSKAVATRAIILAGRPVPVVLRRWYVEHQIRRIASTYRPTRIELPAVLIRSNNPDPDPLRGWGPFIDEIEFHQLDCTHGEVIREPHVATTAAILQAAIDEVDQRIAERGALSAQR